MSSSLERRIREQVREDLGRRLTGADWLLAQEHEHVQDAEVRVERGEDISEAVEPLVRWLHKLDDQVNQLDAHRPAGSITRPAGAALAARYAACEAWLEQ